MIKAVAGGGGKGMKIVYSESELSAAWESAQREALAYFGNAGLYLEQYIENARHIEVQVLGDHHGNVVHLYDRECSIQRRHQKIIEEAPSVSLSETVREKLLSTAVHIAKSMRYTSAGTLEFLFDSDLNFYFLEMNTRIQVEHPVTEAITGVDIVNEQIRIAEGKPMSFSQQDITINGHAVECRVYAEDPFAGFIPSAGEMLVNYLPADNQIRIDSAFAGAAKVSSSFDPMIAKITVHGNNRKDSLSKLRQYLQKCAIQGINTNLGYLSVILNDSDFSNNNISTGYCHQKADELKISFEKNKNTIAPSKIIAALLAADFLSKKTEENIWQKLGSWRFPGKRAYVIERQDLEIYYQLLNRNRISFTIQEKRYLIEDVQNQEPVISFLLNGERQYLIISEVKGGRYLVSAEGITFQVRRSDLPDLSVFDSSEQKNGHLNGNHILSPLNGKVIKLNVKKGDKVRKGELLLIIESMKMENNILAPAEAIVSDVMIANGSQVTGKELLIKLKMAN
jgi:3-methylcrotonyl-CoA carboxylase alpha subunit